MAAAPDDRDPYYNTHSTAQQGALRSFRLVQFDPAKPDTFKGWEAALLAGLSDSTAAAVRLGSCPTYGEAAKSLGLNATKAQIGELHCTLTDPRGSPSSSSRGSTSSSARATARWTSTSPGA